MGLVRSGHTADRDRHPALLQCLPSSDGIPPFHPSVLKTVSLFFTHPSLFCLLRRLFLFLLVKQIHGAVDVALEHLSQRLIAVLIHLFQRFSSSAEKCPSTHAANRSQDAAFCPHTHLDARKLVAPPSNR